MCLIKTCLKKYLLEKSGPKNNKKDPDYYLHHDLLTGLPNRTLLMKDLSYCNNVSEKDNRVIIVVDIDHFKLINDSMGQDFADELLKIVADRLNRVFGAGNAYRMDGDEFAVIYNHNSSKALSDSLKPIFEQLKKPYEIRRTKMHINLSMGIALCKDGKRTPEEYLNCAGIALREVKNRGRNNYLIYKGHMSDLVKERMLIEGLLYKALENREFEVYYQPQMIVDSGEILGFEALIRWNSPELGFVQPNRFIKIAEENHLIIPIGEWVLKSACSFIKKLHQNGYDKLNISVNVSIVQLMDDGFENSVLKILEETGLNPERLQLEITETVLVESYEYIKEKLVRLKKSGIRIAMDDFGKGYSSLGVLSQLPIHTLKIDKIFMESFLQDAPKRLITDLVIQIGNKMGLDVLAEGVETQEQFEYLKKYNNIKAQGYYFSKPVPMESAEEMVRKLPTPPCNWKFSYNMP